MLTMKMCFSYHQNLYNTKPIENMIFIENILHLKSEKLLGPPGELLMWSSLTSQPIKCTYLCKCDIT